MKKTSLSIVAAGLVALAFAAAKPAAATTTTFASYNDTVTQAWSFTNTSSPAGETLVGTSIPMSFSYGTANGYNVAGTPILGTLTVTGTLLPDNKTSVPGGPPHFNPITEDSSYLSSLTMTFTADTPVHGMTNLLTVVATDPDLTGMDGKKTASIVGSENTVGETVDFSSDFLNFTGTGNQTLSLSLTSLSRGLAKNGDGYLDTFLASGAGNFSTGPAPTSAPEASSVVSFGALMMLGAFAIIGRRRTSSRTA